MKVLLINGSPHEHGNTFEALQEAAGALQESGIETEIFWIGNKGVRGCMGCGACAVGKGCVHKDVVNIAAEKCQEADGLIVGSPVHYAALSGDLTSFLDRLFYSSGRVLAYKPAAGIVCARRAGTTASLDQINKYFTINQMPVVSSQYWNMVHGTAPGEAKLDLEGMQVMRVLGRNMAWLLQCIEAGKAAGVQLPEREHRVRTNFIR